MLRSKRIACPLKKDSLLPPGLVCGRQLARSVLSGPLPARKAGQRIGEVLSGTLAPTGKITRRRLF
ncbi:MAG: hypothetical protein A3D64_02250 [Candidatus Wildermuthbacteria bacterium RIFCSPHIGHO2_02_FULL_49_9]|uniref:Uncharacterized protein n=2 Tax=Candidatus Wildermuthiibacteriota TaxID=1817923 RepID=A0A1G2QXN3_9BACT|nr:MAG: hypothetical protein A2672_01835 [Candidatus Wildermuthbacteria bacterium RIFCSPHIGHO2_01_FULL_49_22b]OHA70401.1 MAG: hypothetical protein A3D64_02250 [Candidatus Wildermuthbacteria bacterium RIFCSPHIGHO2_02_FULL_49_9]